MRLFDRRYRLQVDTLEVTDLNVAFTIERTARARAGRAEVKVWNLSADHRRQIERLRPGHVFVELHAGYVEGVALIFRGELHRASTERSGPDIVTTIRSRDGGRAREARVSRSHRPGVSFETVVRDVVAAMGVGEGNLASAIAGASMRGVGTFHAGTTVRGPAHEELTRLLRAADLEWSIQDGSLQVLPRGRSLTRPVIRIAAGTGLEGSPTRDKQGKLKVRTRMIPGVTPGCLVQVESEDTIGTFRVEHAVYEGELDGLAWGIDLTCVEPATARRAA